MAHGLTLMVEVLTAIFMLLLGCICLWEGPTMLFTDMNAWICPVTTEGWWWRGGLRGGEEDRQFINYIIINYLVSLPSIFIQAQEMTVKLFIACYTHYNKYLQAIFYLGMVGRSKGKFELCHFWLPGKLGATLFHKKLRGIARLARSKSLLDKHSHADPLPTRVGKGSAWVIKSFKAEEDACKSMEFSMLPDYQDLVFIAHESVGSFDSKKNRICPPPPSQIANYSRSLFEVAPSPNPSRPPLAHKFKVRAASFVFIDNKREAWEEMIGKTAGTFLESEG